MLPSVSNLAIAGVSPLANAALNTPASPRANRLLGSLTPEAYAPLVGLLEPVQLQSGQVLEAPGMPCTHVLFPVDCALTLISVTRDGEMSELALIGREGVAGLPAVLGTGESVLQTMVLRPGLAYRLPAPQFAQVLGRAPMLQVLALRYVQSLMLQMAQGVVCSLHHSVLQRLSSWLMLHRTVTSSDQVRATHETIAQMLGVRRESVTQAAGQLQQAGCISTSRGRILIEDAQALRGQVCECFHAVEHDHRQLWQRATDDGLSGQAVMAWAGALDGQGDAQTLAMAQEAEQETAASSDQRYADIFDFAPVGLLSLDRQGRLIETNLAAAILLGIPRSQSRQYRFVDFVQPESREAFERFHAEVLSGKCRRPCEVGLMAGARTPAAIVRLEATVDESGEENRMVMVNITESHRQMAQLLHAPAARPGVQTPALPGWWHGPADGPGKDRAAPH